MAPLGYPYAYGPGYYGGYYGHQYGWGAQQAYAPGRSCWGQAMVLVHGLLTSQVGFLYFCESEWRMY